MRTPLHVTATNRLRNMIVAGEYREGERLPSEPALARNLHISRATLREALKELDSEGMLHRLHGVGTFVRSQRPALALTLSMPRSITGLIESLGLLPGISFMKMSTEPVFPDDVERLAIRPGSSVVRIERIRTANSQPVAYTIDVVPSWVMKRQPAWKPDENFSLISHLKIHCGVVFGELSSVLMPLHNIASIAEKLEIDPSSHIFFFEEVDRNEDGIPVLSSREYFAPWIFRFTVKREA
jgi:GntR family transcriptional regulator